MAKDPAALLYIDKWIVATTEMKPDARAYYMDLILYQFDKGSLPSDIEELANICRVRFSEFESFKQVFEQVLKHKFKINLNKRLENDFAREIIQKREKFLDKRTISGKISYVIRFAIKKMQATEQQVDIIKKYFDVNSVDLKNEQVLKQVLEQVFKQKSELYINVIEDEDINKDKKKKGVQGEKELFGNHKIIYVEENSSELEQELSNNFSQHESLVTTALDSYKMTIGTIDVIKFIPTFIKHLKDTSQFPIADKEAKIYFGNWFKTKLKEHVKSNNINNNNRQGRNGGISQSYRDKLLSDLQAGINEAATKEVG